MAAELVVVPRTKTGQPEPSLFSNARKELECPAPVFETRRGRVAGIRRAGGLCASLPGFASGLGGGRSAWRARIVFQLQTRQTQENERDRMVVGNWKRVHSRLAPFRGRKKVL